MPQPYLPMGSDQKTFTFTTPRAAKYKCTIGVIANHFDSACGSAMEVNEKTDVSLNSIKVGTMQDPYCNVPSDCSAKPCYNNVPSDVGGLNNPTCFSGMSDSTFCKKGSVQFTISNIDSGELADAKESAIAGEDTRYVIFDMSNTKNRNFFIARYLWYPQENRYVVVTSLYNCHACSCCYCIESPGGSPDGGWCGAGFYRAASPMLDTNGGTYEIKWDGDGNVAKLCIGKVGEQASCDTANVKLPFELNSYCAGKGCEGNSRWHNVAAQKFTSATVTVQNFHCDETITAASPSCKDSPPGSGGGGSCGGTTTKKACGDTCTSGSQCQSGTCTGSICYNCCGDGVCQASEEGGCIKDCGSAKECYDDNDCGYCEKCANGKCRPKVKCQ
jgi:hypothetical protein